MKIVWETSAYSGGLFLCIICGQRSSSLQGRLGKSLIAVVYNQAGQVYGEACLSCVNSGAAGIKQSLKERIIALQKQLQDLEDLNQGDIEVPTLEQEWRAHLD